ncbi:MAG: hypothetical protein JW984_16205 [Deltaproteobacteria bacterium]|uniref:Uncharacterized protein n=1 Tax=Candidatus Zymogenus saltonus TaxID=2844893 RepID=A0A9D8KJJ3_9DELT|nr:hypothetical protein [Candidatus Zymogenus saltonus]
MTASLPSDSSTALYRRNIDAVLCPVCAIMTESWIPAFLMFVAKQWRRSCITKSLIPARLQAPPKAVRILFTGLLLL